MHNDSKKTLTTAALLKFCQEGMMEKFDDGRLRVNGVDECGGMYCEVAGCVEQMHVRLLGALNFIHCMKPCHAKLWESSLGHTPSSLEN